FSSRRRHTRFSRDWSSDVCSSDLDALLPGVDGKTYRLFDLRGRNGLVVAFICNHCPYVRSVVDRIVRDAAALKAHGVNFVAINSDRKSVVEGMGGAGRGSGYTE